ncbi:MAG: hypothetical protein A2044_01605 [Candidatus Firestonebacteria bacterium GWA2_43_8]|nr:MAG: hypothetical protein A2044_01605 [Candidatus Firestonebacteria bacterium GWA2_43_8]
MGNISAGFGRASLIPAFQDGKRFPDTMDTRAFVCRSGKETALIVVADLGCPSQKTVLQLRREVGKAVKLPLKSVILTTTQNHTTEHISKLIYKKVVSAYTLAAKNALKDLKPVKYSFVALEPSPLIHFKRRAKIKGLGAFTAWFGVKKVKGRADIGHIAKMFLEELGRGSTEQIRCFVPGKDMKYPKAKPLFLEKAEDNLLQAVFFKDLKGKPAGSLIRLPAHPVTANIFGRDYHSHDYPGYAREYLEKKFGGRSVFLLGPCGDQMPFLVKKSLKFAKEYGYNVGKLALSSLNNSPWETGGEVKAAVVDGYFTVRKDYPETRKKAEEEREALRVKLKVLAANKAPLHLMKKISDRVDVLDAAIHESKTKRWVGCDIIRMRGKKIKHPVPAFKMGTLGFVGLPSEPFGAYSAAVRKKTAGKRVITFEEANGYLNYIPTDAEMQYGNYEANNCFLEKGIEKALISAAVKAAKKAGIGK